MTCATPAWVGEVARRSHGRLVAHLGARFFDLAAVEDAIAEAYRLGLELDVAPDEPERWVVTVARRRLLDQLRREATRSRYAERLALEPTPEPTPEPEHELGDERLPLLFVCAHPAIDVGVRTPLMLQTVLGLDAARIASAFLVSPTAMSQRLVRAKLKIRDAKIPFSIPARAEWGERLHAVLEAIYAAFGTGWDDVDERGAGLTAEALDLGRLLTRLLPDEGEVHGLLALMALAESRRGARRRDGELVPLDEQDLALWDRPLIEEGLAALISGSRVASAGRFQLEALIQSCHARQVQGEPVDWHLVATLYGALVAVSPTVGAKVGLAAAHGRASGPRAGLAVLDGLPGELVASYQPFHATRAALLSECGDHAAATDAYERALGLTEDPAVRRFLVRRRDATRGRVTSAPSS